MWLSEERKPLAAFREVGEDGCEEIKPRGADAYNSQALTVRLHWQNSVCFFIKVIFESSGELFSYLKSVLKSAFSSTTLILSVT